MSPPRPTMHDVAKVAGVSKMTISRAFSGKGKISAQTQKKIEQAAREVGYEYDFIKSGYFSSRSLLVGIGGDLGRFMGSSYFAELTKAMMSEATSRGYHLVLLDSKSQKDDPDFYPKMIRQRRVDGLIGFCVNDDDPLFQSFTNEEAAVVLIGAQPKTQTSPSFCVDNRAGIRTLFEHLYELGHRKITYLSGPEVMSDARIRRDTFLECASEFRLSPQQATAIPAGFSFAKGRLRGLEILQRPDRPTAIMAANDRCAAGVIQACKELDLSIPEDLSLVGFDNAIEDGAESHGLTTIAQPLAKIGIDAMKELLMIIEGESVAPFSNRTYPGILVKRETTQKPKK